MINRYPSWPWRFDAGDTCFARRASGAFTARVTIIRRLPEPWWPHYEVEDEWSDRHRVSQLNLSSTPMSLSQMRSCK